MATDRELMDATFAGYRRRLRRAAFVIEWLSGGAAVGDQEGRSAEEMRLEADSFAQDCLDREDRKAESEVA